jgi:hypothetical protein
MYQVEYFCQNRARLTDLKWIFYLFGSYPVAMSSVLGEPEIETQEWRTGRTSKHIVRDEDAFMSAKADFDLEAIVNRVVKEWGDADLNQLLDFVYFETEPMQSAKRGGVLDFSIVGPTVPKKIQISLDRARLKELTKKITERAKDYAPLRKTTMASSELSESSQFGTKKKRHAFLPDRARVALAIWSQGMNSGLSNLLCSSY